MEEKVLVGLDDSEESWNAFKYALLEAENKDLEKLTIEHSEEKAGEEEYRAGEDILEEAEKRAAAKGIEVDTKLLVRGYDPDEDIVRFAEENGYDHVIVGHKGRSGIKGALMGSVAKGVVENAHCAVTVVRSAPYFEKAEKRVRPKSIESLLEEHEGIKRAVVIGTSTEKSDGEIVAILQSAESYDLPGEMVMSFLKDLERKGRIESFALPDRVEVLEELPKTEVGTVAREELKAEYT